MSGGLGSARTGRRQCQYIAGRPTGHDDCKCGMPVQRGSSYCPTHHTLCHQGQADFYQPHLESPATREFARRRAQVQMRRAGVNWWSWLPPERHASSPTARRSGALLRQRWPVSWSNDH